MHKLLRIFIITFATAFIIQIVLGLPAVQTYVKKEAIKARHEMFMLQSRYRAAVRGI